MSESAREGPVCLRYEDLLVLNCYCDLNAQIEQAFGPDGLGLVLVKNVPHYIELRQQLLPLAVRLAELDDSIKHQLEDPDSFYNFGWSQGKEFLENGVPDSRKGSFYANPLCDRPTQDPKLIRQQPSYCRPNIWPTHHLPELEGAFKSLGTLIYEVGMLVTEHSNRYLLSRKANEVVANLPALLSRSNCHKGRLLCYLPPKIQNHNANGNTGESDDIQWCGWHTDHGCITGLTSALYTPSRHVSISDQDDGTATLPGDASPYNNNHDDDNNNNNINVDPQAGLYVKNRHGEFIKVDIPQDCIAFQLGEAFQILSGNALQATPHCVIAPRPQYQQNMYRSTFALFMQPRWDEILPSSSCISENEPLTFGEFSKSRFQQYYRHPPVSDQR